jgi:hypothetical protein
MHAPSPEPVKKTTTYSKPKIRAFRKQIARSNTIVKIDKELVWRLVVAADGHLPTAAGVLGVAVSSLSDRLRGTYLAPRWRAWKVAQSEIRRKGKQRRGWWRWRLRGMGIDPLQLDPSDPTWRACFVASRGAAVRDAAAALPGRLLARRLERRRLVEAACRPALRSRRRRRAALRPRARALRVRPVRRLPELGHLVRARLGVSPGRLLD